MNELFRQAMLKKGAELEAEHGEGNVAAVHYKGGGVAFFKGAEPEAHDSFLLYAGDEKAAQETKSKAVVSYVKSCFLCTLSGDTFEQACAKGGAVWVKGPAMRAVNRLSGATEEAPTVFSFRADGVGE